MCACLCVVYDKRAGGTRAGTPTFSNPGGYPVCQSLPVPVPPTSMVAVAQACNRTEHCMGFNSNGWLKRCLPPRCPAAAKGMEPGAPCDLYTKTSPPHNGPPDPPPPLPPPTPIADVEDQFYPPEERAEAAAAHVPSVVAVAPDSGSCQLRDGAGGPVVSAGVGERVFGEWTVLAVLSSQAPRRPALAVMERRWRRWSLLVFASSGGDTPFDLRLRKPLGALDQLQTTRYEPLPPEFFSRAVGEPDDYIGRRIVAESGHGEASYLKAAKFLQVFCAPPAPDTSQYLLERASGAGLGTCTCAWQPRPRRAERCRPARVILNCETPRLFCVRVAAGHRF